MLINGKKVPNPMTVKLRKGAVWARIIVSPEDKAKAVRILRAAEIYVRE